MKEFMDAIERHPFTTTWLIVMAYLLCLGLVLGVLG